VADGFQRTFETDTEGCHALTTIDDHSRFAVGLFACANERTFTVQECLIRIFRRYGLPRAILCDNGPPWAAWDRRKRTRS
jgi:transposase InsO family protein